MRQFDPVLKVLLIYKDNQENELQSFKFAEKGYEVMVGNTSPQGLEAAISFAPDVALIDLSLPNEKKSCFFIPIKFRAH